MVMGDWGGSQGSSHTTDAEIDVAKSLGQLAGNVGAKYTLALGDNFYTHGVSSVDDPRFQTTFESVFTSPNLQNIHHFRVLVGNHDHYGNCSAQIAYSAKSARWHFPSYFYDFIEVAKNGAKVHHVMIDTVLLAGLTHDWVTYEDFVGRKYPSPGDVHVAEDQWAWLEATVLKSTADYLIVSGHYPVWSVCEHGPTPQLVSRLKPLLEEARVSVYLSGHDHCAQYLDEGLGVQYHGIGASHDICSSTSHAKDVPLGSLKWHLALPEDAYEQGAFGHVSITDSGLMVSHYDSKGNKLFSGPVVQPRSLTPEIV